MSDNPSKERRFVRTIRNAGNNCIGMYMCIPDRTVVKIAMLLYFVSVLTVCTRVCMCIVNV